VLDTRSAAARRGAALAKRKSGLVGRAGGEADGESAGELNLLELPGSGGVKWRVVATRPRTNITMYPNANMY
jgi:hypothetical protein